MRLRGSKRFILIVAAIAFAIGASYLVVAVVNGSVGETTDVEHYPVVLKQWSASGLVSHFPAAIPPEAANVRFSALPGFLQGGGHIQLRVQLPLEDIGRIEAELRRKTTKAYAGGGFFDHYNRDQKNNVPTTSFHTARSVAQVSEFPLHYTLYVLHAKDRSGSWNHGETCGAVVSTEAREVIYWAESW